MVFVIKEKEIKMKRIKKSIFPFLMISSIIIASCASTANDRRMKKRTKIIRETEIIVSGINYSVIATFEINIRKQKVFDFSLSSLVWSYYAGTWTLSGDTLFLDYFLNHKPTSFSDTAYIDKQNSEIIFKQKPYYQNEYRFKYYGTFE